MEIQAETRVVLEIWAMSSATISDMLLVCVLSLICSAIDDDDENL
jgi:hypothetical protein